MRIWLSLFVNSLIPSTFPQSQALLDITPIPLQTPSQVIDRDERPAESGLFQSFTSYLSSYAADDPPEPSEEELESTLSAVDCISACSMGTIFSDILYVSPKGRMSSWCSCTFRTMPAKSLDVLIQALLEQLPEESSPVVIVVKPDRPNPPPARTNGHRATSQGLLYDPSVVFILELATIIAIRDEETVELVGQVVADALQNVVRDASNVHPLVISRAVYYLLHLLDCSQVTMEFCTNFFVALIAR